MTSYNSTLQSNNTDLQEVLQILQNKASGGEQATPEISVSSNGLITATAGVKSSTHQLAFQPARTITPSTTSQIAVSSGYYTGGNITVAGDSNLVAGNIKSGVSIFGVSGTLEEGGSETVVDDISRAIITRTISSIEDDTITIIETGAFACAQSLINVNFPACTTINGFDPPGTSTPIGAFMWCRNLKSISFPVCTSIGAGTFDHCSKLTTASFPVCTFIGDCAFNDCYELTTVSFPACTIIGASAFDGCRKLTTISFPVCTSISDYAFFDCSSLTIASFPMCTFLDYNVFGNCSRLATANFPVCTTIGSSAFGTCRTLSSIQLGASSVCKLSNSNAFSSTPFAGYSSYFSGTPHIYVPASLITAYQSATNWTYFSSYFSPIEGLYQTFTVDGIEYQFEEGMTWEDWINSEYNTDGFYINSNYVMKAANTDVYYNQDHNSIPVTNAHPIDPTLEYYSVFNDGNGNEPTE